jgi:uncharacterized protein YqhQ
LSEKKIQIGGQAVIEGVMMRGQEQIATAIRRADGSIDVQVKPFITRTRTHPIYSKPIIRGFVSLLEMLNIGIISLNFSASKFEIDEETPVDDSDKKVKSKQRQRLEEFATYGVAFLLAFLLFGYVPYKLAELVQLGKQHIFFNLFAGSIRIVFFVLYVYLISLMKDIRRVFEYHGAEHKVVSAHEKKVKLTVENVKPFTTIHPRCGTSFMFLVLLIAIVLFSIIDTAVSIWFAPICELCNTAFQYCMCEEACGCPKQFPSAIMRLLYHLPFLPLIAGISYEFLKLSDKNINHIAFRVFTKPGMALQRITTREPDDSQIETAIISLRYALLIDEDKTEENNEINLTPDAIFRAIESTETD